MRAPPRGLLTALGLRLVAIALALVSGFRAVSDDDFARVVIAQDFAAHPRWDASGSSWLPFPFWLTGGVMRLLGTELAVARGTAGAVCLLSVVGVFVAARWCGWDKREASVAASLSALLPYAVWLGVATVPEGFTALLCLLAVSSSLQPALNIRVCGVLCLTAAVWSRYEAWPLAVVLCLLNAWDAMKQQRRSLFAVAGASLLGPLLWMLHGADFHGSAWFFLTRVAMYRQALGQSPANAWSVLSNYPLKLLTTEPELIAVSIVVWLSSFWVSGTARTTLGPPALGLSAQRLALGVAAVVLFLIVGDVRDGAPTHHAERPLLFAWLVLCVLTARPLLALWQARRRAWLGGVALAALAGCVYRFTCADAANFAERETEVAVGRRLRTFLGAERVLIDTGDYGFLALVAGLDRPDQYATLNAADPRRKTSDVWSSQERLLDYMKQTDCQWIVARSSRSAQLRPLGQPMESLGDLIWLRIPPP